MRNLVTVRTILDIQPIVGADAIECATVDGWKLVVKKGEFAVGDACVYFEIDSLLPADDPRFAFLTARGLKEFRGKQYCRLKTVKLRGQVSQGLALPLSQFPEFANNFTTNEDLAAVIGVTKWEEDEVVSLKPAGCKAFPSFIPKTDQERVQNLSGKLTHGERFRVTRKMDGSSHTAFFKDGVLGVCSRNLELDMADPANAGNPFITIAQTTGLLNALERLGRNIAVQSEMAGPGIQKNRHNDDHVRLWLFDIFDIDEGRYLLPSEEDYVAHLLMEQHGADIEHVPVVYADFTLFLPGVEDIVNSVSKEPTDVEGWVFKSMSRRFTFKAINNAYLIKHNL